MKSPPRFLLLASLFAVLILAGGGPAAHSSNGAPAASPDGVIVQVPDPLSGKISTVKVTAEQGLVRSKPRAAVTGSQLAPGWSYLDLRVTVTNVGPSPIDTVGTTVYGYSFLVGNPMDGISGDFDIPRSDVAAAVGPVSGETDYHPQAPCVPGVDSPISEFECRTGVVCAETDIPQAGDCILPFHIETIGTNEGSRTLDPGQSQTAILRTMNPVPDKLSTRDIHTFLRDPRDDLTFGVATCADPAHALNGGWDAVIAVVGFGSSKNAACETPLTLELPVPGETAIVTTAQGQDLSTEADQCPVTSLSSASTEGFTLASVKIGSESDLEQETTSDGGISITQSTDEELGLVAQFGLKLGNVKNDVDLGGSLTWGASNEIDVDSLDQAQKTQSLLNGSLVGDSSETQTQELYASQHLGQSFTSSGVDLEGNVGGEPGSITASASHAFGVVHYQNGDRGVSSVLNLEGSASGGGILSLGGGGNAVTTEELVVNNQDQPVALVQSVELGVDGGVTSTLESEPSKAITTLKGAKSTSTGSLTGGVVATATSKLDLGGAENSHIAQSLYQELQAAGPTSVPSDLGSVADSAEASSLRSIVVRVESSQSAGVDASWGEGLTYGLDFGVTQTKLATIAAYQAQPHQSFAPWSACFPDYRKPAATSKY